MTCESEAELAEVKMVSNLLYEREEGVFKSIRKRRLDLDAQRRKLQSMADQACSNSEGGFATMAVLHAYLNSISERIAALREQDAALLEEEEAQKEHLKSALARQIRLEDASQ